MPENPTLSTDLTGHAGMFVKINDDENGYKGTGIFAIRIA